jgi:glucose-6-phosphate 1-epimerase
MRLDTLNDDFALPGVVRFEQGNGDLVRAVVTTPYASGHVYLQGAHVTHFQPDGAVPVLFTSSRSRFTSGRAIRGGVPVIFPWFGPHPNDPKAPDHGFARILEWSMQAVEPSGEAVSLVFGLSSSATTQATWPHPFGLRYRVTFGVTLDLLLEVENQAAEAVTFQEALHTYCRVGDVERVTVYGLEAATYIDKTDGMRRKVEGPGGTRIHALTDRLYVDTRARCVLDDPTLGRRLLIEKEGSDSTVVWNPGRETARAMADLGEDEWRSMLCVETANAADNAVRLAPGQCHLMRARISVESGAGSHASPSAATA